jgi:hypothetical protein
MMPRFLQLLLLLGLNSVSINLLAQTPKMMVDPLFGIKYDTGRKVFSEPPPSLLRRCELKKDYARTWVYAHARVGHTEYFILSGMIRNNSEQASIIVAVRGSECRSEAQDSFYWLTNTPEWELSEDIQMTLANDALQRYAKAFGGKKQFLKLLSAAGVHEDELAPVLRKRLRAFRSEP